MTISMTPQADIKLHMTFSQIELFETAMSLYGKITFILFMIICRDNMSYALVLVYMCEYVVMDENKSP